MNMQMTDAAVVGLPEEVRATEWQMTAVEEYEGSLPDRRVRLRTDLAARLLGLTGRSLRSENIYVDSGGWLAVAGVDGETFRFHREEGLVLVRPCAYCGTGTFESPRIIDKVDLGYALLAWHPLHEDCEDCDASETLTG